MTPTAPVDDTLLRCQPDSCQARAMARPLGTPASRENCRKATRSPARSAGTAIRGATRLAASSAGGIGTTVSRSAPAEADGCAGEGGAGEDFGAGTVKACPARIRSGSGRPLAAASAATLTWYCRPMAESVSPRRTTWTCPAAEPATTRPARVPNVVILRHMGNKNNRGFLTFGRRPAGLRQALGAEPAQVVVALVDEAHGLGQPVVAGLVADEPPHLLAHGPVGGVPLGRRPQLEDVHRLPGVHLHGEADAVGERHGVGGLEGERSGEFLVELGRGGHGLLEQITDARLAHRPGHLVAVANRQRLPLDRQHAVALQVAEGP